MNRLLLFALPSICLLLSRNTVAQPSTEGDRYWSTLPGVENFSNASVNAVAVSGDTVYFGGEFSRAGDVAASNIVMWDRKRDLWMPLRGNGASEGVEGVVGTIEVAGGKVYVGGVFDRAGDQTVANVAVWDGREWRGLAAGLQGEVNALAVSGERVYAAASVSENNGEGPVFQWHGDAWRSLKGGLNFSDYMAWDLLIDDTGRLIAGARGVDAENAGISYPSLRWSPETEEWSPLSADTSVYRINLLARAPDGRIYGLGAFSNSTNDRVLFHLEDSFWVIREESVIHDAHLETTENFHQLLVSPDGDVYLTGSRIDSASGRAVNDIARWDGTAWNPLGSGLSYGGHALAWVDDRLLVGGRFSFAGDVPAFSIASWNGEEWGPVGEGVSGGNVTMYSIHIDADGMIYVSGAFTRIGDVPANNIARWDRMGWEGIDQGWEGLGKGIDLGATSMLMTSSGELMIGTWHPISVGDLTRAGGTVHENIAEWSDGTWKSPGIHETAPWFRMGGAFFETDDGRLYVGGDLTLNPWFDGLREDGVNPSLIYRTGGEWNVDSTVKGYIADIIQCGDRICMSGILQTPAEGSILGNIRTEWWEGNVGFFDGILWEGSGPFRAEKKSRGSTVSSLADDGLYLYAGGEFFRKGTVYSKSIVRYDPARKVWEPLCTGLRQAGDTVAGIVRDLTLIHGHLFATGEFGSADGVAASNIARWDGTAWHSLGSGLNGPGRQFAVDPEGKLYVVGDFTEAGGKPVPGIAVWEEASLSVSADEEGIVRNEVRAHYDARTGRIVIERSAAATSAVVTVCDLLGRVILREKMVEGERWKEIRLTSSAAEHYFVMISTGTDVTGMQVVTGE